MKMMNLDDLKSLFNIIEIDDTCPISFDEGRNVLKTHYYYPSPDAHSFLRIVSGDKDAREILDILGQSLQQISGHLWIQCKGSELSIVPVVEKADLLLIDTLYLYVPPQKRKMDTSRFIELIGYLRSPKGCPWDRKQTHQTLRTNLLEETYEVLDAIDNDDNIHLQEELGDLLLQIVLHAQIASEKGIFDFGNVVSDVFWKIWSRHPHVFKDTEINSVMDVMTNWEKIKARERQITSKNEVHSILESIPDQLPSLSMAQKFQERAARVGFDWDDISPVYQKIFEEMDEVRKATTKEEIEAELGDLLFAVVNLVRWNGFDAEASLRLTNKKFRHRFQFIERKISENGQLLTDVPLSEMDALWDEAKLHED